MVWVLTRLESRDGLTSGASLPTHHLAALVSQHLYPTQNIAPIHYDLWSCTQEVDMEIVLTGR